jgi:chemotaxis response regulator CheB
MAKEKQPAEQPAHRPRRSGQAALEGTPQTPEPTTAAEGPAAPSDDGTAPQRRGTTAFPIVGVGASAGGLEAFTHFLRALPADTGMAFVLVQHLSPEHESRLVELRPTRSTSSRPTRT